MKIGIPSEIKPGEKRVALRPQEVAELVNNGHEVFVQSGAGLGAEYPDKLYTGAGAVCLPTAQELYAAAELIVKVKEPVDGDLHHLKAHHTLFCYLHLASAPVLVARLQAIGCKAVAFETLEVDGKTPLLAPMSAIAGRVAMQIGCWYLHKQRGGRGVLLGGIHGMQAGTVTIIGMGVAGCEAARMAERLGARVNVLDINTERLRQIKQEIPVVEAITADSDVLESLLPKTDVLIGAVYVLGRKAPVVVNEQQLALLPAGAVAVDISIDQGGCLAGSRVCTHKDPVYENGHVLQSAIANLPAAVPKTASDILSQTILPYVHEIADNRWSVPLQQAINVQEGQLLIEL